MLQKDSSHSYVIQEELHRSKHYVLYRAKNMMSGKIVVIKTANASWLRDDDIRNELHQEALTSMKLKHPHICETIAEFEEDKAIYLVRDFIPGKSLKDILDTDPNGISIERCTKWLTLLLKALDYAHGLNIVHCNITPDFVIIDENDIPYLIGFGKPNRAWLNVEETSDLYHPILYTAPEVFHGESISGASDIYSIGVIAYLMLCKRLPWSLSNTASHLQKKQDSLNRPVQNPEFIGAKIPPWLFSIINKCLMIDKSLRIQTCAELIMAIQKEQSYPFEPVTKIVQAQFTPMHIPDFIQDTKGIEEETTENRIETEQLYSVTEISEEPIDVSDYEPDQTDSNITEEELHTNESVETKDLHIASDDLFDPDPSQSNESNESDASGDVSPPSFIDLLDETVLPYNPIQEPDELIVEMIADPIPSLTEVIEVSDTAIEVNPVKIKSENQEPVTVQTSERSTIEAETKDGGLNHLKKLFIAMLGMSLAVLLFIVVKYYIMPDHPKFETRETDEVMIEDIPDLIKNEAIQMLYVPADTVIVGSMDANADPDEFPIKHVRLRAFEISVHEITQREWMMVYANNPSRFVGENHPVENVTFYDAIDFCNAKSLLDGLTPCYTYQDDELFCDFNANGYRLPTEAEWEHAAKGAVKEIFTMFSGSDNPINAGWFNANSGASTNPVGSKLPNALGLFDMSGNVFEWIWNWYSQYSYRMRDVYSGADSGTDKVIRGGSWYHGAHEMRVTNRNYAKPYSKASYIGFRVVRSL